MTQPKSETPVAVDKWIQKFLAHLATDRGASIYTRRNYRQALLECERWHREERGQPPRWDALLRDDFRNYVRYLGRRNLSRAAIQLRFCALRSFSFACRSSRDVTTKSQLAISAGERGTTPEGVQAEAQSASTACFHPSTTASPLVRSATMASRRTRSRLNSACAATR